MEKYTIIKGISNNRKEEVISWTFQYFSKFVTEQFFRMVVNNATNWEISLILIDENNVLKGVYLLGDNQVGCEIGNNKWSDLKGIEGVALAVDDNIRGQGYGTKLKDYPRNLGYDYIWGQQLKSLNNLDKWLKRRELVHEFEEVYVTLENFRK